MMLRNGLGLYEGQPGYDPKHPWYLPGAMHTDYECKQLVAQGRGVEDLCVFAIHAGTPPYDYVKPSYVPSVAEIAMGTPAAIVGGVANAAGQTAGVVFTGAADGVKKTLDLSGSLLMFGAIAVAALVFFPALLGGRR